MKTQIDVSTPDCLKSVQGSEQMSPTPTEPRRSLAPSVILAPPSRSAFLTRRQVAELIGVTIHCVEKWAERNTGPKFYRHGRFRQARAAYRIEDVAEFLRQHDGGTL